MNVTYREFEISDDRARLQMDKVQQFLQESYWAGNRPQERIEKSIEQSLVYGIYTAGIQVGFARAVTDGATMYWLCDVFIDDRYRGHGLGKKLIEVITQSEPLKDLMGLLGTRDAHGLYEQYGFVRDSERFMRKPPTY
ncbi:GNAT family N-acetyltransferase [Paenibacillus montanisoli]|uniref:N-acetyltransferase n=1 Tax=Paenibacillus montanisoli TaxID=2081970 RepID=A0A328UC97_9BACL|nr:GNAT family N-acetyltransferase [Paenibacillus montanisoli]RAP77984.1 N-acetyltransferase [Paenibacillus montanisoli]